MAAPVEFEVHWDLNEVVTRGDLFFKTYEKLLNARFRQAMMLALRMAKSLAPKGDHNYVIEDLDEIRRAGGSTSSRPASPGGFAISTDQAGLRATGRGAYRISKVPGGTLRRALTMVFATIGDVTSARLGVPATSPAAKYAEIAEIGGTITAKNARYLRYSPDGQTIIFKPVVHRAPHPYALPSLMYVWPIVQALPGEVFDATKEALGL